MDMDDAKYLELKAQIEEIRTTQIKIANALLGSFDKGAIGLIEEQRNTRRELETVIQITKTQVDQISDLQIFRNDIKKIVGGIALAIPILFELGKELVSLLWSILKSN